MAQPHGVGGKLLGAIKWTETAICGVGLIVTTLLIVAQVINRYILHFEIMILNDLALYTFVFFMLLAAAYTTWNEGHVAVNMFREWLVQGRPNAAAVETVILMKEVLYDLTDAENNVKSYSLTNEAPYLEEFNQNFVQVEEKIARLSQLTADDADSKIQVDSLDALIHQKFIILENMLLLRWVITCYQCA